VGHHGSTSSSTSAFLDAVSPEIAVYSAGEGNAYGHPHAEIIERLKKRNIKIYGTDIHGTVKVITDGKTYRIETEKNG
jgi:beta-lactamase superfamily II metal-dependent hydrolase